MGVGNSAGGGGNILRVDTGMLSDLGSQLQTSANALPDPPAPFSVTGADAISAAISAKLPALETPIIEGLPKVKAEASETAGNIVTSAATYLTTDEEIAARIEKGLFDGAGAAASGGGSGAGGAAGAGGGAAGGGAAAAAGGVQSVSSAAGSAAGAGGAAGQMGQMMSMPMQMASQAAQVPQQAMGALGGAVQGGMQGAQQITQMATKGSEDSESAGKSERDAAAGGQHRAERAPVAEAPQSDSAVPDQKPSGPRHAAPDPTTSL